MVIDKKMLSDYRSRNGWDNDEKAYFTDDGKYCVFFYNINEVSMGSYRCSFAIYGKDNPNDPLITVKAADFCTNYVLDTPFFYAPKSNLIITVCGRDLSEYGANGMPYLLINPEKRRIAAIPFDFTSVYYGIEEKESGVLEITERHKREIERCVLSGEHMRQTGRIIATDELLWYEVKPQGL